MFCSLTYIACSATMEFFVVVNRKKKKVDDIFSNLFLTFLMLVELYRAYCLRMPVLKDMFNTIIEKERKVFQSGDKDLIKILKDNITESTFVNKAYFIIVPTGKYIYLIY